MIDFPGFEHHRLNSFEERLRQVQADIVGLQRSHRDLQRSQDNMRMEIQARYDTMEARLETMIGETRRFMIASIVDDQLPELQEPDSKP